MIRMTLVALGLGAVVAAGLAVPATADTTPVGPSGTGPSTSVAGPYRLVTPEGRALSAAYAPPADDVTLTLPAYWTVQVWGDQGMCVVPDTRETHRSDADHFAECRSVPEVTEEWAR